MSLNQDLYVLSTDTFLQQHWNEITVGWFMKDLVCLKLDSLHINAPYEDSKLTVGI